jgi:hypothetical protein
MSKLVKLPGIDQIRFLRQLSDSSLWPQVTLITSTTQCVQDTVQRNNPHTIQELKKEISAAMININERTLAGAVQKFQK